MPCSQHFSRLKPQHFRSKKATGLGVGVGWPIPEAIAMRKPYLDTAHAIQAEVLKRRHEFLAAGELMRVKEDICLIFIMAIHIISSG